MKKSAAAALGAAALAGGAVLAAAPDAAARIPDVHTSGTHLAAVAARGDTADGGTGAADAADGAAGAAGSGDAASTRTRTYAGRLDPVPGNGVHGSGAARIALRGDRAVVTVDAAGLAPVAHAVHLHIGGRCPAGAAGTGHGTGRMTGALDAAASYGGIGASLTRTGDTSPASAFALRRYPSGTAVHLRRALTVTAATAARVRDGRAAVVVHGIGDGDSRRSASGPGPSQVDPRLPATATAPALCGALHAVPGADRGRDRG